MPAWWLASGLGTNQSVGEGASTCRWCQWEQGKGEYDDDDPSETNNISAKSVLSETAKSSYNLSKLLLETFIECVERGGVAFERSKR